MSLISDILDSNEGFVDRKEYEAYLTDRFPNKSLVVLTCMDTRLIELLPKAMGVRNGDVKIIKSAGAIVSHPFGSIMRSILVAIYELEAREIAVIGHHDCGMTGLDCARVLDKAVAHGVPPDVVETLRNSGIDLRRWLSGFASPEEGVRRSVEMIRHHPLLPRTLPVHGLMIHPATGKLDWLIDGYQKPA